VWNWVGVLPLPRKRIRTDGTAALSIMAAAVPMHTRRRILALYLAALTFVSLALVLVSQPILTYVGSTTFSTMVGFAS